MGRSRGCGKEKMKGEAALHESCFPLFRIKTQKLNRTLDPILQRLDKIDKRLEKIEAQKR
jgi:hypothetical protein